MVARFARGTGHGSRRSCRGRRDAIVVVLVVRAQAGIDSRIQRDQAGGGGDGRDNRGGSNRGHKVAGAEVVPGKAPKTCEDFRSEAKKRLEATKATCGNIVAKMSSIPGNPFTGPNAPAQAYKHLERYHGLDPTVVGNRLHKIKAQAGLGAADDVVIGRTGDVYNAVTGVRLGSLTDKTLGTGR
jgi:hypothetical protein